MNLKAVLSLIWYTVVQNIRNKTLYVIALFAGIMFAAVLLFSTLGGEQEKRLLFDLGIGCIEFFGLILAVFAAVTLILEEIESRTIYLVLSRPIMRYQYILGRYAGLLVFVSLSIVLMGGIHLLLLLFRGWEFQLKYVVVLAMTVEKIALISAIALFFSLFSSSAASSVVFTLFFWILGHFAVEMKFLGERLGTLSGSIMKISYYVIPNLQYFNLRDQWDSSVFSLSFIGMSFMYAVIYISCTLGLCVAWFNRKEF